MQNRVLSLSTCALAGVVVDNGVCHPFEYDFFLISHGGVKGTSRPTHYHVVHDENKMLPFLLHNMTYT